MNKGLQFIESNFASVTDEKQHTPFGFDMVFPGMIEYAKDLKLNFPVQSSAVIDAMLQHREFELRSSIGNNSKGRGAFMAYVSEGIGKYQDWEMVMKYQRKNGSLFNSPSATAAALTRTHDSGCLHHLNSLLEKFGNAVPTVYPLDIYARLHLVENLESLGIEHHFSNEIRTVLDETYRCWMKGEEEIFLNPATCAMAFRILRSNGYNVSSDWSSRFSKENFSNTLEGHMKDAGAVLELYKASEIAYPNEFALHQLSS